MSARPSEHVINSRSWPCSLARDGKTTKLFFSACLHSDKEDFIEGVTQPCPQRTQVVSAHIRITHNKCRAADYWRWRQYCVRSPTHPASELIQEHVSEMGVTALLSTHTKFPPVCVHKWACVCGMESEWKCEAGKSLCCLFIFSFQNLGAAFSSTLMVGTAWKHGACCICAHSAALYYFLWTRNS